MSIVFLVLALLGSVPVGAQKERTTHSDLQGFWSGGTMTALRPGPSPDFAI